MRRTRLVAAAAAALTLAAGGAAVAHAQTAHRTHHRPATALTRDLRHVSRDDAWTQVSRMDLRFPTYHPEGLVVTRHRVYLSSTQIIEPTVKYPTPHGRYDRTPGKGIGHLFVISRSGHLLHDIVLGHGIVYHPGGIDAAHHQLYVPVAQYRPFSTAEIDRVNLHTLHVTRLFGVHDHIGGITVDPASGKLVGNDWGSRTFYEWTQHGRQLARWRNPDDVLDYQDCEHVGSAYLACGGITGLPQTPTAGGAAGTYELGGIALISLRTHAVVNEIPFQYFSSAGHVMTRNPLKITAHGRTLTLRAAPDNGEDIAGTQLFTFRTTLPADS